MGVYNSVMVPCPQCGDLVEFQSKAIEGCSHYTDMKDVPEAIAKDIEGETGYCVNSHRFKVHTHTYTVNRVIGIPDD